MLTTLPFSGFYNSLHNSELDWTVEQMFADRATGCHNNEGLQARLQETCQWQEVFIGYAKDYVESFAREFKIGSMVFESLKSPREYNFTTDEIFATLSLDDVQRLRNEVDERALRDMARQRHTSRSGFYSFYSPDIDEWGTLESWDRHQVGTLVMAYAEQESGGWSQDVESTLMEGARCNGRLEEWIARATPDIKRLYKIHEYLNARAER